MFKETHSKMFSNVQTESIIIPHNLLDLKRFLISTPLEKVYSTSMSSVKWLSGGQTEVGSISEITLKDGSTMTTKLTKHADDFTECELEVLSSDTKSPGYTLRFTSEEITYDSACLVTMQGIFREGASADYMTKIKKFIQSCLTDLKSFFGNSLVRNVESCIVSGTTVDALFSQYKNGGTGLYSYVKTKKYSKGDADTVGAVKEIETLIGEKYSLKVVEINNSEYEMKMELVEGSSFKTLAPPTSMVTGIKMTPLQDSKVFVEIANWFSSDIKQEFYCRRVEMSKILLTDFVKLSKFETK